MCWGLDPERKNSSWTKLNPEERKKGSCWKSAYHCTQMPRSTMLACVPSCCLHLGGWSDVLGIRSRKRELLWGKFKPEERKKGSCWKPAYHCTQMPRSTVVVNVEDCPHGLVCWLCTLLLRQVAGVSSFAFISWYDYLDKHIEQYHNSKRNRKERWVAGHITNKKGNSAHVLSTNITGTSSKQYWFIVYVHRLLVLKFAFKHQEGRKIIPSTRKGGFPITKKGGIISKHQEGRNYIQSPRREEERKYIQSPRREKLYPSTKKGGGK